MLEERNRVSEMKTRTLEETILKLGEITREDMEKIAEKIAEIERRLMQIENDLKRINKELGKMAKKTEVKELETLIEFFNPLKTKFVTKEEVKKMLKEYRG